RAGVPLQERSDLEQSVREIPAHRHDVQSRRHRRDGSRVSRRDLAVPPPKERIELSVAVGAARHPRRRHTGSPRSRGRLVAERAHRGVQERRDGEVVRLRRRKGYADAMKLIAAAVAAFVLATPSANLKFTFKNTEGKKVSLSEFRGKVIILD